MHVLYEKHGTIKGHMNGAFQINEKEPQCGFFQRKVQVYNSLKTYWVPAKIYLVQEVDEETGELVSPEVIACVVDGVRKDPLVEWTWVAGHPISEKSYLRMESERLSKLF